MNKKIIINLLFLQLLVSCTSKTEKAGMLGSDNEVISTTEILPINPCDLFDANQLASIFNITDRSLIEMYARDKYATTKQCQFIWQESEGSVKGSQIMIDISHKTEDMGATFSRMLELDLQNGLTALENNQTIIIKPTPLEDFGNFAYHWVQPNFQNVQKIVFQINNNYKVEILFNCHEGIDVSEGNIKNKLIEISTIIKEKL